MGLSLSAGKICGAPAPLMTGGTFVDIDCLSLRGAVFLGVLGLLLAVPVAATIKIVLTHYYNEKPRSG